MKIKLIYFIAILFLQLSCKKIEHTENKIFIKEKDTIKVEKDFSCDELIMQLVKSSNLNLKDYNDNFFVRIDGIKNDTINIHVYTENNLSDDSKQRQIIESTIAWLTFLPNEMRLLNITADPDNPIEVEFKYNNFNALYEACDVPPKKNIHPTISLNNEDCKEIDIEMGGGRECILKNIDIQTAYEDLIKNEEVEESSYYLKNLPSKNQTFEINKNGLISIEYQIDKTVKIIMLYEGGTTEVTFEQLNSNVKRSIYYYAD